MKTEKETGSNITIKKKRIQRTSVRDVTKATFEIITVFKIPLFILHSQQVPKPFFPLLSNVTPPPLHQGTGVIERIDNNVFPLGGKPYLIQF